MKYRELKFLLEKNLVSTIRVVPFPLVKGWCIDILIKEVLKAGSRTDTLESDRSTEQHRKVRRFASIDSAARYLKQLGVTSFKVDMDDSFTLADTTANPHQGEGIREIKESLRKAVNDA